MKPILVLTILAFITARLGAADAPVADPVPLAKSSADSAARVQRAFISGPASLRDLAKDDAGRIFKGELIAPPGRYRLHAPMAIHPLGTLETAGLAVKLRAGNQEQSFNTLVFAEPDRFGDVTLDFVTAETRTPIELNWTFEGKGTSVARAKSTVLPKARPPVTIDDSKGKEPGLVDLVDPDAPAPIEKAATIATCLMLRDLHVERLSPVAIDLVRTDKITYKRPDRGSVAVELRNVGATPQSVALTVELFGGLDRKLVLSTETVTIPSRKTVTRAISFNTEALSWGCAVRAAAIVEGYPAETKQAVFSVPDRFWDVALMATCPAQMTRDFITMDRARQAAAQLKEQGYNGFEAYFWAPCDLLDYTPKTERFFSGQTAYVQSVTGTRNLIAACHEVGIFATFYANLWGGSGEPAFEMMRKHPDWFGSASFHSGALDDAALMTAGIIRGPGHKVWSFNQLNDKAGMGLFDYHADQIVGTRKMFGWDGIRYDSYYSAPWTIAAMTNIRRRVSKEAPDFLFAYNAFAGSEYSAGAMDSLSDGMIMAEGLRIGPGTKLIDFAQGLDSWREVAWPYGATIGPLYGFTAHSNDKKARPPSALDDVLMSSTIIAAGAHPYYGRMESTIGQHPQFALRYAEYLYNTKMRAPRDPDALVKFPTGIDPPAWRALARHLSLGGGRQRVVLHVLNVPPGYVLGALVMKPAAPLRNVPITFKLPAGATVSGAWLLKAVPAASQQALEVVRSGSEATVTLPEVRFYGVVVLEFEASASIVEKLDARTAREKGGIGK